MQVLYVLCYCILQYNTQFIYKIYPQREWACSKQSEWKQWNVDFEGEEKVCSNWKQLYVVRELILLKWVATRVAQEKKTIEITTWNSTTSWSTQKRVLRHKMNRAKKNHRKNSAKVDDDQDQVSGSRREKCFKLKRSCWNCLLIDLRHLIHRSNFSPPSTSM